MSIYPDRRGGKLTGKFIVEVQKDGKRLRERCDSLKDAQVREVALKTQIVSGEAPQAIRKFSKGSSRPQTLTEAMVRATGRLWRGNSDEHGSFKRLELVLSIVGADRAIDDITTEDADDLSDALRLRGLGDATINRYLSTLSKFLRWCKDREYRTTPLPVFGWHDEDEGRIRWITPDEEAALYSHLKGDISLLVRNAILTGMRRGELLSLQPDQISDNWVHLWVTKNGKPRSVPIDREQAKELRYLVDGRMPNISHLRYEWDKARAAMGLKDDPWFVFHACRHTCATRLVEAGENLAVIQRYLGHKRIETTLRYSHINDDMLANARSRLGAMGHNSRAIPPRLIRDATLMVPPVAGETGVLRGTSVEGQSANPLKTQCGRGGTGRRARFRFPA